jgi:hypothetical protein
VHLSRDSGIELEITRIAAPIDATAPSGLDQVGWIGLFGSLMS